MANKEIRREIQESGSALSRHSMNQKLIKSMREGEQLVFGDSDSKAAKAQARKVARGNTFAREQFEGLFRRVLNGTTTPEITLYVLDHLPDYEMPIETPGTTTEISQFSFTAKDRNREG
jgi:hypothetical protein